MVSKSLSVEMLGIIWSAQRDTFTTSFPERVPFISLSCLIDQAKTLSVLLDKSGGSGHPYLVPDIRGNVFNFSPFCTMSANGLSYMCSCFPSTPHLLSVLYINGCDILPTAFFLHLSLRSYDICPFLS